MTYERRRLCVACCVPQAARPVGAAKLCWMVTAFHTTIIDDITIVIVYENITEVAEKSGEKLSVFWITFNYLLSN